VPELPEVEALAAYLRERAVGLDVTRVDVAAISALKTFDPPISSLKDQPLTGTRRWGKFLDLEIGDKHLVIHLARAGWLHYRDSLPPTLLKPGKGPIALRVHLSDGSGFDLTERAPRRSSPPISCATPRRCPASRGSARTRSRSASTA
jgi:formamidopyrimidine-DNA glycosylase